MTDWRDEKVKPMKFNTDLADELMEVWGYFRNHGYNDPTTIAEMVKAYAIAKRR